MFDVDVPTRSISANLGSSYVVFVFIFILANQAVVMGEPAPILGEPAPILGEPAPILGEPAPSSETFGTLGILRPRFPAPGAVP